MPARVLLAVLAAPTAAWAQSRDPSDAMSGYGALWFFTILFVVVLFIGLAWSYRGPRGR